MRVVAANEKPPTKYTTSVASRSSLVLRDRIILGHIARAISPVEEGRARGASINIQYCQRNGKITCLKLAGFIEYLKS